MQNGSSTSSGRSIYLSGPPGTGKSALVSEICHDIKGNAGIKTAYINCMSVKNVGDVYSKLAETLLDDDVFQSHDMNVKLKSLFLSNAQKDAHTYVITLDEMDYLLNMDIDVIYTLFEWSLQKNSRLIVIAIANALDLTDRFLPRLKARNFRPKLLPFLR